MSSSQKSSNLQVFRLMVYRRPLHPELFDLQARRCHRHGEYEVETWITPGGHVVRFQVSGQNLIETVIENGDHLPEHGLVYALPCLGEKDYEMDPGAEKFPIHYVTTVQTEALTENLYNTTFEEMSDFAAEVDAITHQWNDEDGSRNLSLLDLQKFKREVHLQSYHLIGSTATVLRTQSIFEIR